MQGWAETSELSALDIARRFEDAGVAAIIYTDIARDGLLKGLNLEATIALADALFNVARSSLLVAALASGQSDVLGEATRDRLHQPYRLPLFPAGARLLETALQAGAVGAFTSGAGPSVLALCLGAEPVDAVAAAFASVAQQLGLAGVTLRLALSDTGAHVLA